MINMRDPEKPAKKKFNPQARHRARRLALQALYQWQVANSPPDEIEKQFREETLKGVDMDYFQEILHAVTSGPEKYDALIIPFLDRNRQVTELDPIALGILRVACFELAEHVEIPYRVVINEALELAKTFGAEDCHKLVNSVLDRLARQVRKTEM